MAATGLLQGTMTVLGCMQRSAAWSRYGSRAGREKDRTSHDGASVPAWLKTSIRLVTGAGSAAIQDLAVPPGRVAEW